MVKAQNGNAPEREREGDLISHSYLIEFVKEQSVLHIVLEHFKFPQMKHQSWSFTGYLCKI